MSNALDQTEVMLAVHAARAIAFDDPAHAEIKLNANDFTVRIRHFETTFGEIGFNLLAFLIAREDLWVRRTEIQRDVLQSHVSAYASNHRWHVHRVRAGLGPFAAWLHNDMRLGYKFSRKPCHRPLCVACCGRALRA